MSCYNFIFIVFLLLTSINGYTQKTHIDRNTGEKFVYVDVLPKAIIDGTVDKFFAKNMKYPADALAKNISGNVIVGFYITEKGNVENVRILKSVYSSIDTEAIRLIKLIPKWEPARYNEKDCGVNFTMKVPFKI